MSEESEKYSLVVGARGREEYLTKFEQYAKKGVPIVDGFLWGAIFGWGWFVYRKVALVAVPPLAIILAIELLAPASTSFRYLVIVILAGHVIGGLWGYQFYYFWAKRMVREAEGGLSGLSSEDFLRKHGGTIDQG